MLLCCASVLHLAVEAFYLQFPWNLRWYVPVSIWKIEKYSVILWNISIRFVFGRLLCCLCCLPCIVDKNWEHYSDVGICCLSTQVIDNHLDDLVCDILALLVMFATTKTCCVKDCLNERYDFLLFISFYCNVSISLWRRDHQFSKEEISRRKRFLPIERKRA